MKHLERFLQRTEGTYGSRGSYDDAVAPDHNWAYLCGHYKLLLGEAIKLLGGRKDALRFASAHIEKCKRCGEECRESSITSALDLILEELRELRRVQRDGVAGTDLLHDVRHCIGLLNSMILSGETHSDTSRRQVVEAMQAIENMEANVGDHDNH